MKLSNLKIVSNILFTLGGFVTFTTLPHLGIITLEERVAILITLIPAIIIRIFIYFKGKEEFK